MSDAFVPSVAVPLGECLGWLPELVLAHGLADLLTGAALLALPVAGAALGWRDLARGRLLVLGAAACGALGLAHLVAALTLWVPVHGLEAAVKLAAMLMTGAAVLLVLPDLGPLLAHPGATRRRMQQLSSELAQRARAEDALKEALGQVERRVAERTVELRAATVRLVARERALAVKSQLLETTLNAIDYGICIFDPDLRLRAWNAAYLRLTVVPEEAVREGLHLGEIIGHVARAGTFGPARVEDIVRARLAVMTGAGQDQPVFEEQVRADGTVTRVGRFRTPDGHRVFTLTDVTEQRRLEDELRAAKERWELASTGTNDGLFDWDVATGGLYLSPVWCRIAGYEPGELRPRLDTWRDLVHPDDRPELWARIERDVEAGRDRIQAEHRLRHKAGHHVWVDLRARVVHGPDGRPVRVVGTITDVTGRRRAEQALRASEERFRTLYNRTPAMMHSVDQDKRLISVSDHWIERLGYERDAVIGRPLLDLMAPSTRDTVPERFSTLLEQGGVRDLPYQFVTAGGETIDVLLSAIAERHPDGSFRQSLAVLSDVTELRRLERELRQSQERFEMAVSGTRDGVWDWDLATDDVFFSPVWFEILGLPATSGRRPRAFADVLIHPDDLEDVQARVRAHLVGGTRIYEATFRMRHTGGRWIWVESRGKAALDRDGNPYRMVGTMTDISARKQAEAELEHYARELRRSNQDLEQFAYVASHDLQEPLRTVIGYCELLHRRYHGRLDDDAETFIDFAVDGARRMQGLIDDLLAYSRVGSSGRELVPVDTSAVVEIAVRNLQNRIEETGARVSSGRLPAVLGDPSQLVQLFQNLIGNAIKYRSDEPPLIRIESTTTDDVVEIAVRDNGIGIEPRFAGRIFEIFKRLHTRDAYPGSGVGLAICKRIVARHGGRIWLDTGVSPGSCFRFTLGAADPQRVGEPCRQPVLAGTDGS